MKIVPFPQAISRLFAPIEDEMWPSKAFCRWLIIHRLEGGRVKKKLKVDSKSTETIRPNLLVVFAIFPETTNVERIETGDRSIESNSHSSSFLSSPSGRKIKKSNFPPRITHEIFTESGYWIFRARGIINGRVIEWTEKLRKPRLRKFYDLTSACKFVN